MVIVTVTYGRTVESWLSKNLSIPDSWGSAACLMTTCLIYTAAASSSVMKDQLDPMVLDGAISWGQDGEWTNRLEIFNGKNGDFPGEWQGNIICFGDGWWGWRWQGTNRETEELRGSRSHRKNGRAVLEDGEVNAPSHGVGQDFTHYWWGGGTNEDNRHIDFSRCS